MKRIRVGPSSVPVRHDAAQAIESLVSSGYDACELDFEGGFWLGEPEAEELGRAAASADMALSLHAPIPAFMGHLELGQKYQRAIGMLDHSAHLARLVGATLVIIHPGFLLGRPLDEALRAVAEQLDGLAERLRAKDRMVTFGVEVMGRVRELGSAEDVFWLAGRLDWLRPVLDFAHLHAVTDGGLLDAVAFTDLLVPADELLPSGEAFHIHFSDIAFANRNETKHLPYGQGTLRAEPLREALERFDRPATVISESPDEASHQSLKAILQSPAQAGGQRD